MEQARQHNNSMGIKNIHTKIGSNMISKKNANAKIETKPYAIYSSGDDFGMESS